MFLKNVPWLVAVAEGELQLGSQVEGNRLSRFFQGATTQSAVRAVCKWGPFGPFLALGTQTVTFKAPDELRTEGWDWGKVKCHKAWCSY